MRQVVLSKWTAQTASGRRTTLEYITWGASEMQGATPKKTGRRVVLAVSKEKKDLEKLFPGAHNLVEHYTDRAGNCTSEGCWKNPKTIREEF